RKLSWVVAFAACVALLAAGWWGSRLSQPRERKGTTSKAVAMLNRAVDVQWDQRGDPPRLGAPLEPGWLRLKSGLAQIVFYSGARMVIEGPTDLKLISPNEVACQSGRLIAEVPPQAIGFRVSTPQMNVTDLGTSFGLEVKARRTELHVFKGSVEFQPATSTAKQNLKEGAGSVAESSGPARLISANPKAFASLFDLQLKSSTAEVLRHEQWRAASSRLDEDPSLLVHFDFEQTDKSDWRLHNVSSRKNAAPDATIVGCQWVEGRWPDKHALEFRSVSDRVRLSVPGEFESLTLAAWVRVQGLDRQFNSLFMCDGFEAGTAHWLIRKDGVLGLTAIGAGSGNYQICASPPVLALDQLGIWLHLAVVLDGNGKRVVQYVNGLQVSAKALKVNPPFRVGAAELGNWNASGFRENDPSLIRNFSGAMDEFCLFSRALNTDEIRKLYSAGKPQPDPLVQNRN
ncbi:MAG TPA: LamG-like jellyroll fold domain-containing protein, partial [Verrucomicrobiae bacterium]|nr:LamG-like jellyroll fold domain-containing protein [Verrucomicrobiae bacterium]